MSASWMVNVGGRAYGPYTNAQMASFAAEGRIALLSLVARVGEEGFRPAGEDADLAPLFADTVPPADPPANELSRNEQRPSGVFGRNTTESAKNGEQAHIVIVADMKSRSIAGLEDEIYKLGQAYQMLPQIWILRTDQTVNTVRNILVQQLGKLDALFVVDATNDKAAWFNFGPEVESRIRRIWSRSPDASSKIRAIG